MAAARRAFYLGHVTPSRTVSSSDDVETGPVPGLTDLAGLTFYTNDPSRTQIAVDGVVVSTIARNGPDHTGTKRVSVPWHSPLEFPDV